MNYLQLLEVALIGGSLMGPDPKKNAFIKTVDIKEIPDKEDFRNKFIKMNKNKRYFNLPDLPFEFLKKIPKDEMLDFFEEEIFLHGKSLFEFIHSKTMKRIIPKHPILETEEQYKEIFEKYFRKFLKKYNIEFPELSGKLFEPNKIFRDGLFFSFLEKVNDDEYVVDFTNLSKYDYISNKSPILKAYLKLENGILDYQKIERFDRDLNLTNVYTKNDEDLFNEACSNLIANCFMFVGIHQHLISCHFIAGTNFSIAIRFLSKDNPIKQFLWNFVPGTIRVNSKTTTVFGRGSTFSKFFTPFDDTNYYNFIRDYSSAEIKEKELEKIFVAESPLESELVNDMNSLKEILYRYIKEIYSLSELDYSKENNEMIAFLKEKIPNFKNKEGVEILTDLVYAVTVHHELVGNNIFKYLSNRYHMSYGTNKYSYVALVNAAVVTLTLGRKIFSYDVEIIKNEKVKNLYISMISDLIEFEKTIKKTDPYQIRMYPSNIEAGIQV